jgi:hypothetical protein
MATGHGPPTTRQPRRKEADLAKKDPYRTYLPRTRSPHYYNCGRTCPRSQGGCICPNGVEPRWRTSRRTFARSSAVRNSMSTRSTAHPRGHPRDEQDLSSQPALLAYNLSQAGHSRKIYYKLREQHERLSQAQLRACPGLLRLRRVIHHHPETAGPLGHRPSEAAARFAGSATSSWCRELPAKPSVVP